MLRVQKSSCRGQCSLLPLVWPPSIRRLEEQLGFTYLETLSVQTKDLYHTGIEFTGWDLETGLLRFNIHGSNVDNDGPSLDRPLVYRLRDHTVSAP